MFRDDADQQHAPTPARLQTARADGDVTLSRSLAGAIQLLGALLLGAVLIGQLSGSLRSLTQTLWTSAGIAPDQLDLRETCWVLGKTVGIALLPLMGLMFVISVLSHIVQTGPMLVTKRVSLDVTRVSPTHWLGRVFSISHFLAALMDLPKLIVVLFSAGVATVSNWQAIFVLGGYQVDEMVTQIFGLILRIGFQTALILFLFGLIDYGFRWMARQKRLRMSDEQLREEARMQNGNAQTTDRRRRLHRELTSRLERPELDGDRKLRVETESASL